MNNKRKKEYEQNSEACDFYRNGGSSGDGGRHRCAFWLQSKDDTYDQSYRNKTRIREELDKTVLDDPTKPIFVITHLNPMDSVYGSDAWGNADIHDVLQDYPRVISLSGHFYYTVANERSIWQGNYTAMSTQSLDYIELEEIK